jgi:DNA mismatch endonuclease (patch repair protein)
VVFCDGDFWHGRDWEERREKLKAGANAEYWVAKIGRNIERDRKQEALLRESGWVVLRFWESEILADTEGVAGRVLAALQRAG